MKAKLKNNYEAAVTVRDTGRGIDPSLIQRLFAKFATKPELGGTELGLFIAKRAKGATFSFSIPSD